MNLQGIQISQGATLAPDAIPLHFGDLKAEYHAALENAVLMDRSHEGRIELAGQDRLNLMHRMSTNDLLTTAIGEGRSTIFTNATARVLDRVTVYNRGETALVITEPGRAQPFYAYLQRNIFFTDDVRISDLTSTTKQFALHGPLADTIMSQFIDDMASLNSFSDLEMEIANFPVYAARRKPLSVSQWIIISPAEGAAAVWRAICDAGASPAGSLTYNTLRIRAGFPGVNRELTLDYIPLEIGLWDEISFSKGCYTGQEIIARMESRNRLARIMVILDLDAWVEAPASIYCEGREVGTLTSSVVSPDGEVFAIGVLKTAVAQLGQALTVGVTSVDAHILNFAGTPPPQMIAESENERG